MDRRIKNTRMVLGQTLLGLLKTKPLEKISVTELCSLAQINRATYYMHYKSVYELLHEIQDDFYESIKSDIAQLIQESGNQSTLRILIEKIKDNKELCEVLFLNTNGKFFQDKIIGIAKNEITRNWPETYQIKDRNLLRLISEFIISGGVGMIQDWISNGCKEEPEEIAFLLEKMSENALNGSLFK